MLDCQEAAGFAVTFRSVPLHDTGVSAPDGRFRIFTKPGLISCFEEAALLAESNRDFIRELDELYELALQDHPKSEVRRVLDHDIAWLKDLVDQERAETHVKRHLRKCQKLASHRILHVVAARGIHELLRRRARGEERRPHLVRLPEVVAPPLPASGPAAGQARAWLRADFGYGSGATHGHYVAARRLAPRTAQLKPGEGFRIDVRPEGKASVKPLDHEPPKPPAPAPMRDERPLRNRIVLELPATPAGVSVDKLAASLGVSVEEILAPLAELRRGGHVEADGAGGVRRV